MYKIITDRKPPLPTSPMRLRSRRSLGSNLISLQTPQVSLTKSQKPIRELNMDEKSNLQPEYHTISCELRALAKMVNQEIGNNGISNSSQSHDPSSSLFERGRLYNEYTARRNERLKRKKCGEDSTEPKSTPLKLGVTVESSKKIDSKTVVRKSISAPYVGESTPCVVSAATPRYALRSMSKENKKTPLRQPKPKSLVGIESERKTALRRVRRL